MIQSQVFEWSRGEGERPLERCYTWALKNCTQLPEDAAEELVTPMLVLQIQTGNLAKKAVYRHFMATTLPSFWGYYTALGVDTKRHCDEVIGDGPCKAYCDFEYEDTGEMLDETGFTEFAELIKALDAAATGLINEIVTYHRETHGVRVTPFITTAPKANKWSKHVVFVDSLWRNARHVGGYMRRLKERHVATNPLVDVFFDMQVYGRMRCMRTYRSSKFLEPTRSLRRIDEPPAQDVDETHMLESLITVFPAPLAEGGNDEEPFYVTTAFLERFPQMIHHMGFRPIECADVSLGRILDRHGEEAYESKVGNDNGVDVPNSPLNARFKTAFRLQFAHYKAYDFKWNEREAMLRIECNSRQCVIAERTHEGNHVYLDIDVLRGNWRHGCHDQACARRGPTHWRPLSDDLITLCAEHAENWRYVRVDANMMYYSGRVGRRGGGK